MKKSIFKRVTSFVLASAVAASAVISAFAEGTGSITIYPGDHSKTGDSTRYYAYQIFTGNIEGTPVAGEDHDHTAGGTPKLLSDEEFTAAVTGDTVDEAYKAYFAEYVSEDEENTDTGYDAWLTDYQSDEQKSDAEAFIATAYADYKAHYWDDIHTMTNIDWGDAIDDVYGLLEALSEEDWTGIAKAREFKEAFTDIYNAYKAVAEPDEAVAAAKKTAAQRVAKILGGIYDFTFIDPESESTLTSDDVTTEFLQKFAKVVADNVTGGTAAEWDEDLGDKGAWKASGLEEGYYLVVDTKTLTDDDKGDYIAPYFLDVVDGEDIVVYLKSEPPTIDKTIIDADSDKISSDDKTALAGIGDTITYQLVGTLPENFSEFNKAYYYRFADTLGKGLTYVENSVAITLDINGTPIEFYKDGALTTAYTTVLAGMVSVKASEYSSADGTNLTVTFKDLVAFFNALKNDGKISDELDEIDWTKVTITVTYNAVLNENAEIGSTGNKNTAKLIYTNDSNSDYDPEEVTNPDDPTPPNDTNTTTESETIVFTFEIDIDKQDTHDNHLAGAGFTVTNGTKTAVFVAGAKEGEYVLVGWTTDADNLAAFFTANEKTLKNIKSTITAADLVTQVITSSGDGYIESNEEESTSLAKGNLHLKGLCEGTYTFTETKIPEGYTGVNFDVTLVAEVSWTEDSEPAYGSLDDYNNAVAGAGENEVVVSDDYKYTGNLVEEDTVVSDDSEYAAVSSVNDGKATLGVFDPDLHVGVPGTGGAGVYFYYIVGGILVAVAAAVIFLATRKSDKKVKSK